jgi:hypothetical protein
MLVVNLFAGPGAGKSTIASGVFTLLKLHNVNCELVTEFAKDLVWEERKLTIKNQYYVFGKQQHRIYRLKDKVDVAVTDSPLLLNLVYGRLTDVKYPDSFFFTVKNVHNGFDNMNFFIKRAVDYNDIGRIHEEEECNTLDQKVRIMLRNNGIRYDTLHGDYSCSNVIAKRVLDRFDIKMQYYIDIVINEKKSEEPIKRKDPDFNIEVPDIEWVPLW